MGYSVICRLTYGVIDAVYILLYICNAVSVSDVAPPFTNVKWSFTSQKKTRPRGKGWEQPGFLIQGKGRKMHELANKIREEKSKALSSLQECPVSLNFFPSEIYHVKKCLRS